MDLLPAFVITLALITLVSVRYRISPFFTLIGGSVLFGLLAGLTLDATMLGIVAGIGKVFSAFGIIILCGAVIAKLLQEQHQTEEIVADIRQRIKNPPVICRIIRVYPGSTHHLLYHRLHYAEPDPRQP